MILSSKSGVRIADLYCGEQPPRIAADVVRYNQWPGPVPGWRYAPFHTMLIDLARPDPELLESMDKGTRYDIRRAVKDGFSDESLRAAASERELDGFCDFYDQAAAFKGLPPVNRPWLRAMARAGALELTRVMDSGAVLAWHVYYRDPVHAVLLFSQSAHRSSPEPAFRQKVSRANRYLHWKDMERFRIEGLPALDMGGWYAGREDGALLAINKFKEDLGGRVVETYNSMAGITLKGRLAVWYMRRKAERRASRRMIR